MSIITREDISYMIQYFRNRYDCDVIESSIELGDTKPEFADTDSSMENNPPESAETDSSMEDKPDSGSDSVEDKPVDEEEAKPSEDNVEDIEGPWYSYRKDVKNIGDILVGFYMEKMKSYLIEQAADSYVASRTEFTDQSKRRRLLLDLQESLHSEADTKAVLKVLVENTALKIVEEMRPIIVAEYVEAKKKRWIELCGTHTIENLRDVSKRNNFRLFIHLSGFYEKEVGEAGFGFIIRDFRGSPLLAYSEYLSNKETHVSLFYHELQGVKKALELAVKWKLEYIKIYCSQSDIGFLVMKCQAYEKQCRCDPKVLKQVEKRCEKCVRRCVLFCQESKIDDRERKMIYDLLVEVMDNLSKFKRGKVSVLGYPTFNSASVRYLVELKENVYLAKSKSKSEVDLRGITGDLSQHPGLREILFGEASEELGPDVFSLSLSLY